MIVGTAGHIDHGKTTLVRALTGVDTDRLPEEKARGISIELGYAFTPMADGRTLAFVDVPGHEKFIPSMLAGATGIDLALLVVAADDGVMPQTREHLDILTMLGVELGAIVVTKVDVVDADRVDAVIADVRGLLTRGEGRTLPAFPVCARDGSGVAALRAYLEDRAAQRKQDEDGGHFRLAVDRVFTLAGIGTVVTGTVHSGVVRPADRLVVAPGGRDVRVRSVHAQNRAADRAVRGERCALNLAGASRDDIARGDWIVAPPVALSTDRFDARYDQLASAAAGLRSGTQVQVHIGAAHAVGRVVVLSVDADASRPDEVAPGRRARVQVTLTKPMAAWHGDRFVLRDASASSTLGGGVVLDPFAPARYRRTPERLAQLAALEETNPADALRGLLAQAHEGVDLDRLARALNVRDRDAWLAGLPIVRAGAESGGVAILREHWSTLADRLVATLDAFHREHPDRAGPDRGQLKRRAFPRVAEALVNQRIETMAAEGRLRVQGPWIHLPSHDLAPSPQQRAIVDAISPRLLERPHDPPWVRDLARDAGLAEAPVREALLRASKQGELYQVVRDLFYHPVAIRALAAIANELQLADGEVRAATFRDRSGLGRKRAIQVLEFFDRIGFTRRVRDRHLVRAPDLLAARDVTDAPPEVAGIDAAHAT